PDGNTFALVEGKVARSWTLSAGRENPSCSLPAWVNQARLTPDGRTLAVLFREKGNDAVQERLLLGLIEVATGTFRRATREVPEAVAEFAPDCHSVALAGTLQSPIYLWDCRSGKNLARLDGHQSSITGLAFTPSGNTLITASNDTTCLVWDLRKLLPP